MIASPAGGTPRIAVVGGGIGGVAAAAFLRRAGLPAVVYEQAGALREAGAGIVLAPNAVRLLRRLGVMDALAARAVPLDVGWAFRRWEDGRVLSAEDLAARASGCTASAPTPCTGPTCTTRSPRPSRRTRCGLAGAAPGSRSAARARCCRSTTAPEQEARDQALAAADPLAASAWIYAYDPDTDLGG